MRTATLGSTLVGFVRVMRQRLATSKEQSRQMRAPMPFNVGSLASDSCNKCKAKVALQQVRAICVSNPAISQTQVNLHKVHIVSRGRQLNSLLYLARLDGPSCMSTQLRVPSSIGTLKNLFFLHFILVGWSWLAVILQSMRNEDRDNMYLHTGKGSPLVNHYLCNPCECHNAGVVSFRTPEAGTWRVLPPLAARPSEFHCDECPSFYHLRGLQMEQVFEPHPRLFLFS